MSDDEIKLIEEGARAMEYMAKCDLNNWRTVDATKEAAVEKLARAKRLRALSTTDYIDHQQRSGVAWDIIEQALELWQSRMPVDDHDAHDMLRHIIGKIQERHALYALKKAETA